MRWPATLLSAGITALALVVPWILLQWLIRADGGRRPSIAFEWAQAINSVTVASAAAVFTAIVTHICRAQGTALYQNAAVPALLLLAVLELSMVVLLAQEGSGRGSEGRLQDSRIRPTAQGSAAGARSVAAFAVSAPNQTSTRECNHWTMSTAQVRPDGRSQRRRPKA